ncbi:MAG: DNA gyrase subunit B [Spirochaetes bacterium]|nr:MAG: DNA gyrase subunit B [Spirochaetota bacterium]
MTYSASDITTMDPFDHIRARVGVYLGNNPFETAVREVVDNAFDEVFSKHGDSVTIVLHADESIEIIDNGRGIPVDFDAVEKKNGVVKSVGTLMSGSKFSGNEGSAGLNGMGTTATNAISQRFDVTVWRGGKEFHQNFRHGRPGHFSGDVFDLNVAFKEVNGEDLKGIKARAGAPAHGTSVRLVLDKSVARDAPFDINNVLFRAHCSQRMIDGAKLTVVNEGWPSEVNPVLIGESKGKHGASELLKFILTYNGLKGGGAELVVEGESTFVNVRGDAKFTYRIAASPSDNDARIWGFANGVYTPLGGSHIPATARGIAAAFADKVTRMRGLGLQKGEAAPGAEDFAAVCMGVVSVTAPEVHFSGQAKEAIESKSLNINLAKDVERRVSLWASAPANSETVTTWAKVALEYARTKRSVESARARARSKSQARSLGENLSLPEKLLPSRASGRGSGAELFICEGDSALGTIKAARDSSFQAAFPLKGKPMNVYNMTLAKARANTEFDAIERILGCGARDKCDPEQSRYDRILFASDADPDGGNINSMLSMIFLENYRPLVQAGMVYVTLPPLFVVSQGDTKIYCQTEDDRDIAVAQFKDKYPSKKVEVQRNKGLGEMNADDFWNTVLDPTQRTVMQLTLPDAEHTDGLMHTLFGGPAQGRRDWITDMTSRMDLSSLDLDD